jgi:hypothetical protein
MVVDDGVVEHLAHGPAFLGDLECSQRLWVAGVGVRNGQLICAQWGVEVAWPQRRADELAEVVHVLDNVGLDQLSALSQRRCVGRGDGGHHPGEELDVIGAAASGFRGLAHRLALAPGVVNSEDLADKDVGIAAGVGVAVRAGASVSHDWLALLGWRDLVRRLLPSCPIVPGRSG